MVGYGKLLEQNMFLVAENALWQWQKEREGENYVAHQTCQLTTINAG